MERVRQNAQHFTLLDAGNGEQTAAQFPGIDPEKILPGVDSDPGRKLRRLVLPVTAGTHLDLPQPEPVVAGEEKTPGAVNTEKGDPGQPQQKQQHAETSPGHCARWRCSSPEPFSRRMCWLLSFPAPGFLRDRPAPPYSMMMAV